MVELLVAMTLLSLIVLVLMTVFNSTQQAFRSSMTQTDILEGSRAAMDLMTTDLRNMVPSDGAYLNGAVNFYIFTNGYDYKPLVQSLPGSSIMRTNVLQYFFSLGRRNTTWTGVGYVVDSSSASPLFPLFRFYAETSVNVDPTSLYSNFLNCIYFEQWTNMSHVMDGVVHLTVNPYDYAGYPMTNTVELRSGQKSTNQNVLFWSGAGPVCCAFYSNAVPAAIELQLGVLEDRSLQRAQSLGIANTAPYKVTPQWNYLTNQCGHVQVFRQRVTIPNVDPSAYQ